MGKKFLFAFVGSVCIGLGSVAHAAMFQSVPVTKAHLLQKGEEKQFCSNCGMNLVMFYKTSHAADVDGKVKQYCSLHCLVAEKELHHAKLKNIQVVAVDTLDFIDAKKAYYVVGSSKKGTMSRVSKYAFSTLKAASHFAAQFGGVVSDFNGAVVTAKKDF